MGLRRPSVVADRDTEPESGLSAAILALRLVLWKNWKVSTLRWCSFSRAFFIAFACLSLRPPPTSTPKHLSPNKHARRHREDPLRAQSFQSVWFVVVHASYQAKADVLLSPHACALSGVNIFVPKIASFWSFQAPACGQATCD